MRKIECNNPCAGPHTHQPPAAAHSVTVLWHLNIFVGLLNQGDIFFTQNSRKTRVERPISLNYCTTLCDDDYDNEDVAIMRFINRATIYFEILLLFDSKQKWRNACRRHEKWKFIGRLNQTDCAPTCVTIEACCTRHYVKCFHTVTVSYIAYSLFSLLILVYK